MLQYLIRDKLPQYQHLATDSSLIINCKTCVNIFILMEQEKNKFTGYIIKTWDKNL